MFIGGVKRRGWCVCMWMGRGVLFTPTSSIIFTILPLGEPTGLLIMSLDLSHTHTPRGWAKLRILNDRKRNCNKNSKVTQPFFHLVLLHFG